MAHFPPDLRGVIEAWPTLSEADRNAMMAIVKQAVATARS